MPLNFHATEDTRIQLFFNLPFFQNHTKLGYSILGQSRKVNS